MAKSFLKVGTGNKTNAFNPFVSFKDSKNKLTTTKKAQPKKKPQTKKQTKQKNKKTQKNATTP